MAERTDIGGGPGTATPNLDPFHEQQANSGTSTLGAGSTAGSTAATPGMSTGTSGVTGTGGNFGNNTGSLGNMSSFGGTGSSQNPAGPSGQNPGEPSHQGVARQVKDQAKNLASEAKDQTVKAAEQARDHVQDVVSQQKDQAAGHLGSLAGALREAGHKLNEDEQSGGFGRYTDQAADQVERLSNYLRDSDLTGFVRDGESFARRRPEVFLGGAFLAGLALARFLKASSPDRGSYGYGGYGGNGTGDGRQSSGRSSYAGTGRSSYTSERPDLDVAPPANLADAGTTPYKAPLGV